MTKAYFMGGSGIKHPKDFNGDEINIGDILTNDCFDSFFSDEYYKKYHPSWTKEMIYEYQHKPFCIVKWNDKGFFYANGMGTYHDLYLYDFRFKYTKIHEKRN